MIYGDYGGLRAEQGMCDWNRAIMEMWKRLDQALEGGIGLAVAVLTKSQVHSLA